MSPVRCQRRTTGGRRRGRRLARLLALGVLLLAAGMPARAQFAPSSVPRQPPPPPERIYPGAADRALLPPEILRDDRIDPDSGVQISLGPHEVALRYPKLKLNESPNAAPSEGVVISANVLFGDLRLGYSRQFYRRALPAGTQVRDKPANFLAIDSDQFWATLGWRPWYRLYLGVSAGAEYRLIRVRQDATDILTETDTLAIVGLIADFLITTPFSLQVRVTREDPSRALRLESTVVQIAYLIPF